MEKRAAMWFFLLVVALAPLALPPADAAMTCGIVANALTPCISYVMYGSVGATVPPPECCNGVKSLYNQATAPADRQEVCTCLKSVAGQAAPNVIDNAAALPGKCGVSIPYKISPQTDCRTVH